MVRSHKYKMHCPHNLALVLVLPCKIIRKHGFGWRLEPRTVSIRCGPAEAGSSGPSMQN